MALTINWTDIDAIQEQIAQAIDTEIERVVAETSRPAPIVASGQLARIEIRVGADNDWQDISQAVRPLTRRTVTHLGPVYRFDFCGPNCPICNGGGHATDVGEVYARYARAAAHVTDEQARASLEQSILSHASVPEVLAVRDALRRGQLYNTASECVIAVIARERGISYSDMPIRAPVFESWLYRIPYGGARPEDHQDAATLDAWLTAWLDAHTIELPPRQAPRVEQPAPAMPVYRQVARPYLFSSIDPPAFSGDASAWRVEPPFEIAP